MNIAYYLPTKLLSNGDIVRRFPEWTEEKIFKKTGIQCRHIAADDEDTLSLAKCACGNLFLSGVDHNGIDFILLCTQSPKFRLPSTACLLQHQLDLPTSCGALDYDLGCSGFVYGLSLAKGLVKSGAAKNLLLVTSEMYSKYVGPEDKSTLTIFGDGAAAMLVDENAADSIGEFVFGTDGSGAEKLILPNITYSVPTPSLKMDGPEIFNFTLEVVPRTIEEVCRRNQVSVGRIDLFVFHQANRFMLDTIRKVANLPKEKFYVNMQDVGNTVSSSIPIALKMAEQDGALKVGMKVMVVGFGVGLSWAGTIIDWG